MTGTLSVGGAHRHHQRAVRHTGDIEATATLEVGRHDAVEHSDVSGNTEMTGTLSVGGTHADTDKELYVNGDIEATATLEVGGRHDAVRYPRRVSESPPSATL